MCTNYCYFIFYVSTGPCEANLTMNANAKSLMGQTALHDAVTVGYREVVSLLIKHGADVNLASKVETPQDQTDVVPSGTTLGSTSSPLQIACCQGDLEMLKLLLNNGAVDVDHKCLNSAIMADNVDVMTILLQQGKVLQVTLHSAVLVKTKQAA